LNTIKSAIIAGDLPLLWKIINSFFVPYFTEPVIMLVSALLILVAVALLRRLGHSRWLAWFLLAAILMLTVLSGLQIGLGQITGEGVNGAVFYHLRAGLEGGDVSQYGWGIAAGLVALAVVAGGLWRARRWIRPGSATPARRWDTGIAL
jgi:hypothetical protein